VNWFNLDQGRGQLADFCEHNNVTPLDLYSHGGYEELYILECDAVQSVIALLCLLPASRWILALRILRP
jgi:hypothetical protein